MFATYATEAGHTLIDRELYLPRCWADEPDRRQAAGVPADVEFATKPELATAMITRAVVAGVSAGWVAADDVYGGNTILRRELEIQQLGYVLAVSCDHQVHTGAGTTRSDTTVVTLGQRAWQRVSADAGAHGQRYYDWALVELDEPDAA
ncbi:SRSO17 transposase [Actinopolyspora biskrensis]|uniref:SRSO17 transposase n=1 Tax=Actinopolyspora biskrensis TaxID=1470178 RepID=A0A852YZ66_9ACTN|nr:SRSO17 transposase [Actinopolyspora biskrensis]